MTERAEASSVTAYAGVAMASPPGPPVTARTSFAVLASLAVSSTMHRDGAGTGMPDLRMHVTLTN